MASSMGFNKRQALATCWGADPETTPIFLAPRWTLFPRYLAVLAALSYASLA